jgi:hypothetical protein
MPITHPKQIAVNGGDFEWKSWPHFVAGFSVNFEIGIVDDDDSIPDLVRQQGAGHDQKSTNGRYDPWHDGYLSEVRYLNTDSTTIPMLERLGQRVFQIH